MNENDSTLDQHEAPALTEADYLAAAKAGSTRKEYQKDMRYFADAGYAIPATVDQVATYLTQMAGHLAVSTIERRLVSLHVAHLEAGYPSPVHAKRIKTMMQGVRRTKGVAVKQATAIVKDDLLEMLSAASRGRPMQAARNAALLLVGWAGAFRRSELAILRCEDVLWLDSGVEITLRQSKVDQTGAGFVKFLPNAHGNRSPHLALQHWMEVSGITEGYLFRPINRHDQIGDRPLTPHAISQIVKKIIEQTGRDPAKYSGHSLRAGFITEGVLSAVSEHLLMMTSGHRSTQTFQKYVRLGKRRRIPSLL